MIGGVTLHMLPHLSGVLYLHVNRPLKSSSRELQSENTWGSNTICPQMQLCKSKLDCLIFEILFIKELKSILNKQYESSDSIRSKLFV